MSDNSKITIDNDTQWSIHGELGFHTVSQLLKDFKQKQKNTGLPATIDLNQVTRTDSAGLALLVEWLKIASQTNKEIQFLNFPKQLLHIAEVSEADTLLSVV